MLYILIIKDFKRFIDNIYNFIVINIYLQKEKFCAIIWKSKLKLIFEKVMRLRQTFASKLPLSSSSNERERSKRSCLQSNFFNLQFLYAMLAQLDRAFVYGTKGQGFESLASHQRAVILQSFFRDSNPIGVRSCRTRTADKLLPAFSY